MKSRFFLVVFLMVLVIAPVMSQAPLKVGLVLSIGGLGDESFNDAAYEGVLRLRKTANCIVEVVEPGTISSIEPALRYLSERDLDLICGVGIFANDAIRKVATDYPDCKYALLDSVVTIPNVLSILFDEEQGSFFAGVYAGLINNTNTLGFLGGMDSPIIASFERGFRNGVRFVRPEAEVVSYYLGETPEAFDMPDKAFELGMKMAEQGADVIFHASGRSGLGLINAARRGNFLVIGVDSDQSRAAPGRVPASMVKRIDKALFKAVELVKSDSFTGGIWTLGLRDQGIELVHSRFNRELLTAEVITKLKEVENFLMHRPYPDLD